MGRFDPRVRCGVSDLVGAEYIPYDQFNFAFANSQFTVCTHSVNRFEQTMVGHGTEIRNRVDRRHVEPCNRLHEDRAGVRQLLC